MSDDKVTPREKRNSVIIRAVVHLPGGRQVARRIRNLSAAGGCMDEAADLAVSDHITLDMGALSALDAEVVWVKNGVVGIRFSAPVDLSAARKPRGATVTVASGRLADPRDAYR